MKHVVLAKDDPAVVSIFPHYAPPDSSPGWVGTAIARMISIWSRLRQADRSGKRTKKGGPATRADSVDSVDGDSQAMRPDGVGELGVVEQCVVEQCVVDVHSFP